MKSNLIHSVILKAEVDAANMVIAKLGVVLAVRWMDCDRFLWVQYQDAEEAAVSSDYFGDDYRMRVELLRGLN